MTAIKQVGEYVIRGKGITYGGVDLHGEYFTADTDYGDSRSFVGMPVYYDHAHGGISSQIGVVKAWIPEDTGIDVEVELNRRHAYADSVMALVKEGALGLSTGAVGHLVVVRKTGEIKRWVVGEISLTPTPAEPRSIVSRKGIVMRSAVIDSTCIHDNNPTNNKEAAMPQEPNLVDVNSPEFDSAVAKSMESLVGARAPQGGVFTRDTHEAPKAKRFTTRGFSNEQTEAFCHWVKTNDNIAAKATLVEGTGANGGYNVPIDMYTRIVAKRDEMSLLSKYPFRRITTSREYVDVIPQDEKSDFTEVGENASASFDEPTFAQRRIQVYTASLAYKISNQLLNDTATDLETFLADEMARGYARYVNARIIAGTGSSQPYGIVNRATTTETLASTTGVDVQDIINMYHKLPEWYVQQGMTGWILRNSTLGAIRALTSEWLAFTGTPMGGMNDLYGQPFVVSDKIATMAASAKSIIFGNYDYYAFVENGGMEIARNPYLYQANNVTALFAYVRIGGDVIMPEAFVLGVNAAT
jgi:HK97 family phage major capsid protein